MLDGEAYKSHFPDDPAYEIWGNLGAPRRPDPDALLQALAALEIEFRTILSHSASSTE
jgi:hypothetical protein